MWSLCANFFYKLITLLLLRIVWQEFACNGTVVEHPEYGEVIQLQGDQRQNISKFIKQVGLAREDQIKVCMLPYCCGFIMNHWAFPLFHESLWIGWRFFMPEHFLVHAYAVSQKTQDTVLVSITLQNIMNFQNSFTVRLSIKFSTKWSLHSQPHLKGIAALVCETVMLQLLASCWSKDSVKT